MDVRNACQESDGSEPETFRVKRRSSSKAEHRDTYDSIPPGFENQVMIFLFCSCHCLVFSFYCYPCKFENVFLSNFKIYLHGVALLHVTW